MISNKGQLTIKTISWMIGIFVFITIIGVAAQFKDPILSYTNNVFPSFNNSGQNSPNLEYLRYDLYTSRVSLYDGNKWSVVDGTIESNSLNNPLNIEDTRDVFIQGYFFSEPRRINFDLDEFKVDIFVMPISTELNDPREFLSKEYESDYSFFAFSDNPSSGYPGTIQLTFVDSSTSEEVAQAYFDYKGNLKWYYYLSDYSTSFEDDSKISPVISRAEMFRNERISKPFVLDGKNYCAYLDQDRYIVVNLAEFGGSICNV